MQIISSLLLVWIIILLVGCGWSFWQGRRRKFNSFRLHGGFVIAAIVLPALIHAIGDAYDIKKVYIQYATIGVLLAIASYTLPRFFRQWGFESR